MKGCDTCQKRRRKGGKVKCAVLTENIGLTGDCWAWTNDLNWAQKAEQATKEYARRKGEDN